MVLASKSIALWHRKELKSLGCIKVMMLHTTSRRAS
jgi:hypothetical protein